MSTNGHQSSPPHRPGRGRCWECVAASGLLGDTGETPAREWGICKTVWGFARLFGGCRIVLQINVTIFVSGLQATMAAMKKPVTQRERRCQNETRWRLAAVASPADCWNNASWTAGRWGVWGGWLLADGPGRCPKLAKKPKPSWIGNFQQNLQATSLKNFKKLIFGL